MPILIRRSAYRNFRAIQAVGQPFTINRFSQQAKGLVHWWPTLGNTGAIIRDLAGQVDGVFPGAPDDPVHIRDAKFGNVLDYGASHFLDFGSGSFLTDGEPFSIAWWIRLEVITGFRAHFNLLISGETAGFGVLSSDSGSYTPITFGSANAVLTEFRPTTDFRTALLDTWAHFVITYDGGSSTSAASYGFFYDGVSFAVGVGGGFSGPDDANQLGHLGSTGIYLDGQMGDFRIYNRALSAGEVFQQWSPATRWELYLPLRKALPVVLAAPAGNIVVLDEGGLTGGLQPLAGGVM